MRPLSSKSQNSSNVLHGKLPAAYPIPSQLIDNIQNIILLSASWTTLHETLWGSLFWVPPGLRCSLLPSVCLVHSITSFQNYSSFMKEAAGHLVNPAAQLPYNESMLSTNLTRNNPSLPVSNTLVRDMLGCSTTANFLLHLFCSSHILEVNEGASW